MDLKTLQSYIRRVRRQTGSTVQYFRLAIEGNKVERLTDFKGIKRPVLLLQGYGGTRRVFQVLEQRLRRDGFNVFSLNLGGIFDTFNTKPIPHLAQLVSKKIESLYKRHNIQEKLVIIGHSKGGLIGRCYLKDFHGDRRVKTLITMGTPHNGNPWAMLGLFTPLALLTESIRQMTPMSPFIRRMNRTPWPEGVKVLSIFSKEDTVCPYPSAVLKTENDQVRNLEIVDVGHVEFLMKKRVYWLIRKELLGDKAAARRSLPRSKIRKSRSSNKSKALVSPRL
ncbi:MAG: alpha/beta fold hydrolase [Deltaproteobacteria bacterium]|nr:alpha/beta fold hydrolase [Deltaproteobacteria bacterium]